MDYVLDDIDLVMIMAINPGIVGHPLILPMLDKIAHLKEKLGNRSIEIEVDGGVSPESSAEMIRRGATRLVCGSSTIFRPHECPLDEKIHALRFRIDADLERQPLKRISR